MWRLFWRSIDRFSLQHFKYVSKELRGVRLVDNLNREFVVDLLKSIVEIVTYGDRRDPAIFEYFMEYQIMAEFVRLLNISGNSYIEGPLLHYLSIMIQNMTSEQSIYYCLSNEYVNNIILHQYQFDAEDLATYYISFLRTVSSKLNRDTLYLLVRVQEDVVTSFPLYTEALKFACHEEKMIQIAIRALTLNIYKVSNDMVYEYITASPVSEYFSDVVLRLRQQCFQIDAHVITTKDANTYERRKILLLETEKFVDDLHYCKDIIYIGESCLSRLMIQNFLNLLVLPTLLPSLNLSQRVDGNLSAITSLYILCCLLQLVDDKELVNAVAVAILYPYAVWNVGSATPRDTTSCTSCWPTIFVDHVPKVKEMANAASDSKLAQNISWNYLLQNLSSGIMFSLNGSENCGLLFASMMLSLILSETGDLDYLLSSKMEFAQKELGMNQIMTTSGISFLHAVEGGIFKDRIIQILKALLKVLVNQPSVSILAQWSVGWLFWKFLTCHEKILIDHGYDIYNASYKQACELVRNELDGSWFDYIPFAVQKEWENCKAALEESSQSKDPFFLLELSFPKNIADDNTFSSLGWKRMIDAVKVFVLHHQLKKFIFNEDTLENPLLHLRSNSLETVGPKSGLDTSLPTFGTEMALGLGVPCKITSSKNGVRDIYLIPEVKGISGKLFLVEKISIHTQRGVVIAIAPLAGLIAKIDEKHPTWLHLQIREFTPTFDATKITSCNLNSSNHVADRRWTLGFPNSEACEAARLLVLEQTSKLRSSVLSLLNPLLQNNSFRNFSDKPHD